MWFHVYFQVVQSSYQYFTMLKAVHNKDNEWYLSSKVIIPYLCILYLEAQSLCYRSYVDNLQFIERMEKVIYYGIW
jgi:hypothetical protein